MGNYILLVWLTTANTVQIINFSDKKLCEVARNEVMRMYDEARPIVASKVMRASCVRYK